MTFEIGLLLAVIAAALVFFSFERIPAEVTALGVLMTLILAGLLPGKDAFAGFGSDTVMLILGLLIMSAALLRTGVVDWIGRFSVRQTGQNPSRMLLFIMVAAAGLSAFISNTACAALFIPLVSGLASQARIPASRLLLPLAFASILSSSVSLISTSTNVVISGLMTRSGLPPMGVFELAPVGLPITVVGLAYMYFVGRRLIPDRSGTQEGAEALAVRPYFTEVMILASSKLIGKTLAEAGVGRDLGLTILQIVRDKTKYLQPRAKTILKAGDVLLVEGQSKEILKIKDIAGIDIKADVKLSEPGQSASELGLVECLIIPRSPLIGRTLKGIGFRERYGLQVLGVNRHGAGIHRKISQVPLRLGDVLLVQGDREKIGALNDNNSLSILSSIDERRPNVRRAPLAIAIFAAMLLAATFQLLSLPVAAMLGAFLVLATNCINPEQAYRDVEWRVILLIGSMLGLGAAMDNTGAAGYLASLIVRVAEGAGPVTLLSGFFVLTLLLTQPMSNQAAAVVVLPVALETAAQLNLNPRSFAMMIAVAASCSYLTPLEPACLLVYGPGRYRFFDFLRVGAPLTLLIFIIAILLVPRVWPL